MYVCIYIYYDTHTYIHTYTWTSQTCDIQTSILCSAESSHFANFRLLVFTVFPLFINFLCQVFQVVVVSG